MLEAAIAAAKRILEAIFYKIYTESNLRGWRISMNLYHLYINGLLAKHFY